MNQIWYGIKMHRWQSAVSNCKIWWKRFENVSCFIISYCCSYITVNRTIHCVIDCTFHTTACHKLLFGPQWICVFHFTPAVDCIFVTSSDLLMITEPVLLRQWGERPFTYCAGNWTHVVQPVALSVYWHLYQLTLVSKIKLKIKVVSFKTVMFTVMIMYMVWLWSSWDGFIVWLEGNRATWLW